MRITKIVVLSKPREIIDISFSEDVTQPELLRSMEIFPLRSNIWRNIITVVFHGAHQEEDRRDAAVFFSVGLEGFITRGLTTYDELLFFQKTLGVQIHNVNNLFLRGIELLLHRQQRRIQLAFPHKNATLLNSLTDFDRTTVPKKLCCAISHEIMDDPIIDPTMCDKYGHEINTEDADRFERDIFTGWISSHENKSPATGKEALERRITDKFRKAEINLFMRKELLARGMHLIINDLYFKMNAECKLVFMQGTREILITAPLTKEISEEIIAAVQNLSALKELLRKHIGENASLIVISAIEAKDMMLNAPSFLENILHLAAFAQRAQRALTRLKQVQNIANKIVLLTIILLMPFADTDPPRAKLKISLTNITALEEEFRKNPLILSIFCISLLSMIAMIMAAGCVAILDGRVREQILHVQNFLVTTRDKAYAFWNGVRGGNNPAQNVALDGIRGVLDRPVN